MPGSMLLRYALVCVVGFAIGATEMPTDLEKQLLNAVGKGELEKVRELLELGVSAKSKNDYGETALHLTAIPTTGGLELMKLLIAGKAEVNARTEGVYEGHALPVTRTPLHWLVYNCDSALIDTMIQAGADVNMETEEGKTPLDMVLPLGERCKGVKDLLLAAGGTKSTKSTKSKEKEDL